MSTAVGRNPLFDEDYYRDRYAAVIQGDMPAEQDYFDRGLTEGRWPNPLFDASWYVARYPDVASSGANPLNHYYRSGAREGRDPSSIFSTSWYVRQYADVQESGVNPLLHFLRHGLAEGRLGCPPEQRLAAVMAGTELPDRNQGSIATARPRRPERITMFYGDDAERSTVAPLAHAARRRGYEVELSTDLDAPAEVGVYCHQNAVPHSSRLSVVMPHDIGQEWYPEHQQGDQNHWRYSPWNECDIGVLPGATWSTVWREVSTQPSAQPKLGVFELGWPKADRAFRDPKTFVDEVTRLRRSLGLRNQPSVLLALTLESKERYSAFISALGDMPVNRLIKPNPQALQESREGGDVVVIEPTVNILHCLALADVVVSDSSGCLAEALLFDVPGIALNSDFAHLQEAVQRALRDRTRRHWEIRQERDRWFSYIGRSADRIVDVIDAALEGAPWPIEPLAERDAS